MIFLYQIIQLTVDYSQYNVVIDMKAKYFIKNYSISICIDSKHEIKRINVEKSVNETQGMYLNSMIKCVIYKNWGTNEQ